MWEEEREDEIDTDLWEDLDDLVLDERADFDDD
jgi:hypothetical protein